MRTILWKRNGLSGLMVSIFCASILFCGIFAQGADDRKPFNAAILHGTFSSRYGKNLHHDEYDRAIRLLGWKSKKYRAVEEDIAQFSNELSQYNIVLVSPLFNCGQEIYMDMNPYGKQIREFVEKGGAVVVTDALYPDQFYWLKSIDPGLAIESSGTCRAKTLVADTDPKHPIRFLPNTRMEGQHWGHLCFVAESNWETVSRCGEGYPATLMKRIGKGFVYVSAQRQPYADILENIRANLELQHIGLTIINFDMPPFKTGEGKAGIMVRNTGKTAIKVRGEISVEPLENTRDKAVNFTNDIIVEPGKETLLSIPYAVRLRGKVYAKMSLENDRGKAVIFDRETVFPDLLTVKGPRYRGITTENELKKARRILVPIEVSPFREKLEDLRVRVCIARNNGAQIGTAATGQVPVVDKRFLVPVRTGNLKAGEYLVTAELFNASRSIAKRSAPLTVLKDSECPVYINDNMNLVADGKEFFPIGIYHINPKDIPEAAELGFNTVQMFNWFFDDAFAVPAKYNMKVLFEQNTNHRYALEPWIGTAAAELAKKFPNALMWYGYDEPNENTYDVAKKIKELYHAADKGHPTYFVSCMPLLFDSQTDLADVFAVDPYPYNGPDSNIVMVSEWVDKAWEAVKGDKPVFCVPQSFGGETPEALRAMTYQAIIHEARGIIWYPWDESDGKLGLKYNKSLHPVMKQLVTEIKTLSPALLNPGRKQFKSEDGMIHGLLCLEPGKKRYLLLVNPHQKEYSIKLNAIKELKGVKKMKNVFGDGILTIGEEPLKLVPYETKAYFW